MANTRGDVQTTLYFPPDLHEWFKLQAVRERVSLTNLVVRACLQYRTEQEDRTP
jgi:hypothetical protein